MSQEIRFGQLPWHPWLSSPVSSGLDEAEDADETLVDKTLSVEVQGHYHCQILKPSVCPMHSHSQGSQFRNLCKIYETIYIMLSKFHNFEETALLNTVGTRVWVAPLQYICAHSIQNPSYCKWTWFGKTWSRMSVSSFFPLWNVISKQGNLPFSSSGHVSLTIFLWNLVVAECLSEGQPFQRKHQD